MSPRTGILVLVYMAGYISYIMKIDYFFKNKLRQTESIVMMTKEESTKIVKFYLITPGAGVPVLGRGHIVNVQLFLLLFLSTLGHGSDKLSIKQ